MLLFAGVGYRALPVQANWTTTIFMLRNDDERDKERG